MSSGTTVRDEAVSDCESLTHYTRTREAGQGYGTRTIQGKGTPSRYQDSVRYIQEVLSAIDRTGRAVLIGVRSPGGVERRERKYA